MPHPKIYKMDRSLSCRSVEMDDYPNKYSRTLVSISQSLTSEDFSSMKLILQTNQIISSKTLEQLNNSQDLISILDKRGLISQEDLSFLGKTLKGINRMDLLKKCTRSHGSPRRSETSQYQVLCEQPSSTCYHLNRNPEECFEDQPTIQGRELEYSQYTELKDPVEHEGAAAACMEDDSDCLQSSQGSITDDDKMAMI